MAALKAATAEQIAQMAEQLVAEVLLLARGMGVTRDEAIKAVAKASLVCRSPGCMYHSDPDKMRTAANIVAQLGLDMADTVDEWQDAAPTRSN